MLSQFPESISMWNEKNIYDNSVHQVWNIKAIQKHNPCWLTFSKIMKMKVISYYTNVERMSLFSVLQRLQKIVRLACSLTAVITFFNLKNKLSCWIFFYIIMKITFFFSIHCNFFYLFRRIPWLCLDNILGLGVSKCLNCCEVSLVWSSATEVTSPLFKIYVLAWQSFSLSFLSSYFLFIRIF